MGPLRVLALPYTTTEDEYDAREVALKHPDVDLVVGHLTVPGMQPGEETHEMGRGRPMVFPVEETKHVMRMNGHYHRRTIFTPECGGTPIIIPGSLARLTFSEEGNNPGFLVVEVPYGSH